jgi:hypothetical protein
MVVVTAMGPEVAAVAKDDVGGVASSSGAEKSGHAGLPFLFGTMAAGAGFVRGRRKARGSRDV